MKCAVSLRRGGANPRRRISKPFGAALVAFSVLMLNPAPSHADEGGVSFWLPGLFGSLAAVPGGRGVGLRNHLCSSLRQGERREDLHPR